MQLLFKFFSRDVYAKTTKPTSKYWCRDDYSRILRPEKAQGLQCNDSIQSIDLSDN